MLSCRCTPPRAQTVGNFEFKHVGWPLWSWELLKVIARHKSLASVARLHFSTHTLPWKPGWLLFQTPQPQSNLRPPLSCIPQTQSEFGKSQNWSQHWCPFDVLDVRKATCGFLQWRVPSRLWSGRECMAMDRANRIWYCVYILYVLSRIPEEMSGIWYMIIHSHEILNHLQCWHLGPDYVYRGPDCLYVHNIRKHIQLVQVCTVIYSYVYSCSDFIMWIPGQQVEARTQRSVVSTPKLGHSTLLPNKMLWGSFRLADSEPAMAQSSSSSSSSSTLITVRWGRECSRLHCFIHLENIFSYPGCHIAC